MYIASKAHLVVCFGGKFLAIFMTSEIKKKYCVANSLFEKPSNYQDFILILLAKQIVTFGHRF
jgi:hypothetical protein